MELRGISIPEAILWSEPVTIDFVAKHLQNIIRYIGLNPAFSKGHSFRIGADSHAAQFGYYENCIQKMEIGCNIADTFGCQALHLNPILLQCNDYCR